MEAIPAIFSVTPPCCPVTQKDQRLVAQIHAANGDHEAAVQQLLQRGDVDYIEVRDKIAGCYDFRIERARTETTPSYEKEFKC